MLKEGDSTPAFSLPDQHGDLVSLRDLQNTWIVLYFYPKDNTPGCTLEAIDFTKNSGAFQKLHAVVLGVSPDSPKSHCSFIAKQDLKLRLLSDEKRIILEKYGVWKEKSMYGKKYMGVERSTFLINPAGKIAKIWRAVTVDGHVRKVLKVLQELKM